MMILYWHVQPSQLDVSDGHFDQQSGSVYGRRYIHASVDQTDEFLQSRALCHFLHAEQRFRPGLPDRLVFDTLPLPYLFNIQYNSRPFDWMDDVTSSRKKPGRMNRFPPRAWRFHSGKTRGFSIIIRHFHFIFSSSLSLRFLASLLFVHLLLVFCAVHFHWWMANNTTILGKLRLSHADVAGTFCCSTR